MAAKYSAAGIVSSIKRILDNMSILEMMDEKKSMNAFNEYHPSGQKVPAASHTAASHQDY